MRSEIAVSGPRDAHIAALSSERVAEEAAGEIELAREAMKPFDLFGIKSPKAGGVTGYEVPEYFAEGKIREIAEYCVRDVVATAELYDRWNMLLRF